MFEIAELESPVGPLVLGARDGRLCALTFADDWDAIAARVSRSLGDDEWRRAGDPAGAVRAMDDYFSGDVDALDAVPIEMCGTAFQRRAWSAMRDIPAGDVASYGELGVRIGTPRASRAVGAAAGANLIVVVIPCHRVVGSGGGLGGYGGGLERKRWLLEHERKHERKHERSQERAQEPDHGRDRGKGSQARRPRALATARRGG